MKGSLILMLSLLMLVFIQMLVSRDEFIQIFKLAQSEDDHCQAIKACFSKKKGEKIFFLFLEGYIETLAASNLPAFQSLQFFF